MKNVRQLSALLDAFLRGAQKVFATAAGVDDSFVYMGGMLCGPTPVSVYLNFSDEELEEFAAIWKIPVCVEMKIDTSGRLEVKRVARLSVMRPWVLLVVASGSPMSQPKSKEIDSLVETLLIQRRLLLPGGGDDA